MIRAAAFGAAALALLTGASDSRADRELADAIRGRTAGTPVDCIRVDQMQSPQVIGDRAIVYRDGRRLWVNQLPDACPGLNWNSIVVNEVFNSQICRGDLFKTLDRNSRIPGPACRYAAFTPYVKPARR